MKYLLIIFTLLGIIVFAKPKAAVAVAPVIPKTVFSYSPNNRRFSLAVKNVTGKVTYSIEYTRISKTGDIVEGIQRSGKAKNRSFSGTAYAGTQSSKYFVPHNVRSGTLYLKATDLSGSVYLYRTSFTVNKGKVKYSTL